VIDGIAALITSIAGLITAVGGVTGMVIVARRTSPRERDDAAHRATEQPLNPPTQTEANEAAMITIRQKRRPRRGR
jgi:hypothetical protein